MLQPSSGLPADQGDRARGPSAIPEPPETALPRLAALTRAPPSPLLQWQLLEILYAYCSAMHLFQGDWAFDAMVRHHGCSALMMLRSSGLRQTPKWGMSWRSAYQNRCS